MSTIDDVMAELSEIKSELASAPRKWKDIENYFDDIEKEKIEKGEIDSLGNCLMLEPAKRGITDKQREGAKVGKNNLSQIWIGKQG